MSCCVPNAEFARAMADPNSANNEVLLASRVVGDSVRQSDLSVPSIHCGSCIQKIERTLGGLAGIEQARVNLSTRRVTVRWRGDDPPPFIAALKAIGFTMLVRSRRTLACGNWCGRSPYPALRRATS